MSNIYKVILSKEEMNVIRNGLNLILSDYKNKFNNHTLEKYMRAKVRFDMEYEKQSNG